MKVAVAYKDGQIYEHFGHAETFAVYEYGETVDERSEMYLDASALHGHQAMADLMKENQVDAVICGRMGDEARALLLSYCIVPVPGYCGDASMAADMLVSGTLPTLDAGAGACGGGCGGGCGGSSGGCDCGCGGCH